MSALDTWLPQSRHCVNTNQRMYESEMSVCRHCLCGDHLCCSFGAKQDCQDLSVNDQCSLAHANDTNMFMYYLHKLGMTVELADSSFICELEWLEGASCNDNPVQCFSVYSRIGLKQL